MCNEAKTTGTRNLLQKKKQAGRNEKNSEGVSQFFKKKKKKVAPHAWLTKEILQLKLTKTARID